MPSIIYTQADRTNPTEIEIDNLQVICMNPYKRGQLLVKYIECDTEDEACLPAYILLTVHSHVLLDTNVGKFEALSFTNQNTGEFAYIELSPNLFPYAYVNYAEHKEWCAEFGEPAPTLGQYIIEVFANRPLTVNAFVEQPNGELEFYNGIPITEVTENRIDESLEEIEEKPEKEEE